jgi:hypothetical protein
MIIQTLRKLSKVYRSVFYFFYCVSLILTKRKPEFARVLKKDGVVALNVTTKEQIESFWVPI